MKKLRILLASIAIGGLFFFANCGGGDDPVELTDQQKAAKALNEGSPWTVQSIDNAPDNVNASALENLTLTFGITGTEAEIAPDAFAASGAEDFISTQGSASWSWSGGGTSTMAISGASISQFTSVSFDPDVENPSSVTLSFTVSAPGGRIQGIAGDYTITIE